MNNGSIAWLGLLVAAVAALAAVVDSATGVFGFIHRGAHESQEICIKEPYAPSCQR